MTSTARARWARVRFGECGPRAHSHVLQNARRYAPQDFRIARSATTMPGTFVLDRTGIVKIAHVDPNYTVRFEPVATLDALRSISR